VFTIPSEEHEFTDNITEENTGRRAKRSRQLTPAALSTPVPVRKRSTENSEAASFFATTNSAPCTTEGRKEAPLATDQRDQWNREHLVAADAYNEPVNSAPTNRVGDTLVPPYPAAWCQATRLESAGAVKRSEIDNLFDSETIMEPNFDEAFSTVGNYAMTDHLNAFDASQVMTADFDVWAMQTTEWYVLDPS